ncbi:hypothetical protein EV216_11812 [Rhodovulum steppense]|uniref:Uncharacterized protein n=1 Tax=Rhodovulum steppense TaxID=540251 RepID=A0A4R1YQT4_9RHOB|nr:hypothetical protein EV216_11812 [Rhodovulum steppense]
MSQAAFKETCYVCGREFQYGNHVYNGRKATRYGVMLCKACWESNHDGFNSLLEPKMIAACKINRLDLPNRLPNGLLPRE